MISHIIDEIEPGTLCYTNKAVAYMGKTGPMTLQANSRVIFMGVTDKGLHHTVHEGDDIAYRFYVESIKEYMNVKPDFIDQFSPLHS